MAYDIIEKLKKEIEGYKDETKWEEFGEIIEIGDGIARISGLKHIASQELLEIQTEKGKVQALALNLEEDIVGALLLEQSEEVKTGNKVTGTGNVLSIEVSPQLKGRVINPLGTPLDNQGIIFTDDKIKPERRFLEFDAPNVLAREPVNTPLHTGIKAIDAMIPIGRGQRELIIGDRQTGKTALVLDTILNQKQDKNRTPICIYVAVGQKEAKIARLVEILKENEALEYTIVVAASASNPAAMWYLAPFAGCAIGEYFRDKGEDALVIYDDLTKHAWAYRQISLLLRRPPGREAYPGDIFYLHSRLLERAAKLNEKHGGGSLTALPIIETQLGDVTAYIPTNVISITDGQIYLESNLFYKGVRPAVNVGLSVSRVGSSAQTKAMKKVAGKLRLALAQFRELEAFVQFAADVDEATRKKIKHGQVITEVLKQNDLNPITFEKEVCILYAVLNNYFDEFPLEKIKFLENSFLDYLEKQHKEILENIRETKDLKEEVENKLKSAVKRFVELNK